ncbi:lantibiotic dehydratase [Streptacidiphilus sp. EB129]|uniref:lantibiotic dehydratase n=1 Tax=Streptacidiphilus sp. EB129 TaxID=3156262 RepID=UPI003518EE17
MTDTTVRSAEASCVRPGEVTVAPYGLVRMVALAAPEPAPVSTEYRERVGRLVELTRWCEHSSTQLCAALYDLVGTAEADVRARVLVPLRRDVHNGRSPRPLLRAAVADLAQQLPLLDQWLSARDEMDRIDQAIVALTAPALAADRTAQAALCRSEELQRAVAGTSEDLLRAVQRAAVQGAAPDRQGRKSEPTVLRYAMRAVTRTVPLSWFTQVGWGEWREGHQDAAGREAGRAGRTAVTAVARVERLALDTLLQGVLRRVELRAFLGHRLATGLRCEGAQVCYSRRPEADAASPHDMVVEEQVALPLTAPLRQVLAHIADGGPARPHDLAAGIAARLPGAPDQARLAAAAYVDGLIGQGLLRPECPFDPQAADMVRQATDWLVDIGLSDLAVVLADIEADTESYASLPATARPERLARIRSHWSRAFALAGAAPGGRRTPLTEDVTTRWVLNLGPAHGVGALPDLARLAPLFELFDEHLMARRVARDRFVARFGVGGSCDSLLERDAPGDPGVDAGLSSEVRDLLRLRAELAARVRTTVPAAGAVGEVVLPDPVVDDAARRSPTWLRQRPVSYGVFMQPVPVGGVTRLLVNHVYGGWGRFTSRFLDQLEPRAREQVAAQLAATLGAAERVAQIRPVGGFNANLHPRIVADEVSDSGEWSTLRPEQLQLVHDTVGDQLRLRVAATGELINVLYLGFLMPIALPAHWRPLANDLGGDVVNLGSELVPGRDLDTVLGRVRYRPRLRYRDVILTRAQWRLPAEMARAWRAELDRRPAAQVVARWRAALGIPERVFLSAAVRAPAPAEASGGASGNGAGPRAIPAYLSTPKSQYLDLGSALHVRCLSRTLARYPGTLILEEALPEPTAGQRAVEIVAETYRSQP